ncbi:ribosomal protein S4 (RPS4A) family protein [Actinidia rufa]|uniref:Ribosomal protein S4 (RPS4A) family protein n=1 Tax=Actinidia rufa TaxID=165716 RepID=A0A7J0E7J1_9ERIC|nr:ribosomal protein S4 (RPS4A) family protein [Actinidia rufa]
MGDSSTKNVVEEVIAYSDDIIEYLEVEKDANILTQHLEYSKVLQSQCLADSNDVRSLLQVITNQISDLEHQRVSVEEQRQILKNLEQDELRAQPIADIVQIDKRLDEMFEFDPTGATAFDTCNSIWKMSSNEGQLPPIIPEGCQRTEGDLHEEDSSDSPIPRQRRHQYDYGLPTMPQSLKEKSTEARRRRERNTMARGLKKHLKRLNAPSHWMLDKLGGAFAPKPSSGPHKSRECLPLILILRNRLKYALTYREVIAILMQRHILVDGKVRTDKTYPSGFMDVVSIPKTNENFRLLYDTKGRFRLHSIRDEEAKFKLCKVRSVQFGQKGIPYINTYDGRTIRYPDPLIKANDTIKLDLESNKVTDFIKFDVGNVVMVTGGRNRGRVGVIKNREKHKGSFETIHIQDATGHEFATRMGNVFTIGKGSKPWVSLPKGKGIKLSIIEEARKRLATQAGFKSRSQAPVFGVYCYSSGSLERITSHQSTRSNL